MVELFLALLYVAGFNAMLLITYGLVRAFYALTGRRWVG